MTKHNVAIAAALRASKKFLARNADEIHDCWSSNRYEYICHALERVSLDRGFAVWEACRLIHRRLYPESTVDEWLSNHGVLIEDLNEDDVQAYRHRWVDALIKELES